MAGQSTTVPSRLRGDWRIRPATNRDGDALADLIGTVYGEYPGCVFDRAAEFPELDAIGDDFVRDCGRLWLAVYETGEVLGCLGIKYDPDSKRAELHKVYLQQATRGQGIAQRLMARALTWLGDHYPECTAVGLWTDTRFAAGQRFYEKCGFVRTGQNRILDDLSASRELEFQLDFSAYQKALMF
ncbi:GNAT family N-acetyltransferase [Thalassospira sp. MA62]|nr:GNAT family N-acetyltransferase [Thalassospira sp. MA62]